MVSVPRQFKENVFSVISEQEITVGIKKVESRIFFTDISVSTHNDLNKDSKLVYFDIEKYQSGEVKVD
jgi:hypothetical protein